MTTQEEKLDQVASLLRKARSVLFVTGAGLSADSGMPTYRGVGGLYEDAEVAEGFAIEEVLSGEMLERQPQLTWKYLHQIGAASVGKKPNRGHEVMAALERMLPRVWVLTQNVDGFHRMAGSQNVIDIHGDMRQLECTLCGYEERVEDYQALREVPHCPACGGVVRPAVVLFGEALPPQKLRTLMEQQRRGFDVVFSVGTSSLFPYIIEPVYQAARRGLPTVEINPGVTTVSPMVQVQLKMGAAEALGELWERLRPPST